MQNLFKGGDPVGGCSFILKFQFFIQASSISMTRVFAILLILYPPFNVRLQYSFNIKLTDMMNILNSCLPQGLVRTGSMVIPVLLLALCSCNNGGMVTVDLSEKWDTTRVLENPDKGWYHHMLDNGIEKYLIQDEEQFHSFPGMDHLYLRLAWGFLEPEEGVYDWSHIDRIVEKYVPLGYGISFRITCKETGNKYFSAPFEINGVRYATPPWVEEAGAVGVVPDQYGPPAWTPDWDDPVFLEKLDNFHRAFARTL